MKKSLRLITLTGILALSVPVVLGISNNAKKADAYSAASLPTTIDLNDTSEANIRSYYSSLNSLGTAQRQGTNLLKNLKTILKNNQKYYSYENGNSIWQMYEITDRDWEKSPASSISGYNSSTKKITGYSYGSSDPYVRALYVNRNVNNQTTAWSDHQQTQWGINREHVWPKAEGFDESGAGGARGDPRHLMAGNGYANNIHSNYYYGYVKTSASYTDCGSKYSNLSGNLKGTSKTLNTGTVFEPQDCDKGDIARAIFYMVARYNYYSGSDSDGIDTNNPNLALTQNISDWSSSGYTSSTSRQGKLGIMTDLLAWHHADPVDEIEIHRNNLLYTNFTNNRNPFVDFPEWADFIWGSVNYNGSTYVSHSTTPTGYATPNSDTINGYNSGGGDTPEVNSVSVSPTSVELDLNSATTTAQLTATVSVSHGAAQTVTWESENSNVVTVSNTGLVTAVGVGHTTINVISTVDSSKYATCSVTVIDTGGGQSGDSSSVDLAGGSFDSNVITWTTSDGHTTVTQTASGGTNPNSNYISTPRVYRKNVLTFTSSSGYKIASINIAYDAEYYGDSMTAGTSITNNYVDDSPSTVARTWSSASGGTHVVSSVSSSGLSTIYVQNVAISNNIQLRPTSIIVNYVSGETATLDSISLDTSDTQTTFHVGDTFNYDDLVVTANYDDGSSDIVAPTSVSSPNMSTAGQKTVTVSYTEGDVTKTATYTITVNAVTLSLIEVSNAKTAYYVGDSFVKPTVTATFSNGSTSDVTNSATFSGYNLSNAGNQTVSVSYTSGGVTKTTSYSITVTAVSITSITISGYTTSFNVGDTFSFGGTVTAHYNNGSSSDVTASANFTGYNMSTTGTQTVTVSYGGQTATYQITVTSSGGTTETYYQKCTSMSDIENGGRYVIIGYVSSNTTYYAMPSYSSGNNIKGVAVTLTESNTRLTEDNMSTAAVYTLTSTGTNNQYYIGDGSQYLYAAGTGTSNHLKGKAETDSTAGAFTISYSTFFSVVAASSNRNTMRFNDTNKNQTTQKLEPLFSCYASNSVQTEVMFFKEVQSSPDPMTSITATVNKTFAVGETISSSDLSVKGNNGQTVYGFSFVNDGYRFTYTDAASGGASTSKTFTNSVTYQTFTCSLTVNVARTAYETPLASTITHTGAEFGAAGIASSYTEEQTATVDGITFAVDGYIYYGKLSLSSSQYSAPGSVVNTTPYPAGITNVTVNGATPDIQLSTNGISWVDLSAATPNTTDYYYLKIYYKTTSQSNYVNINYIDVSLKAYENAINTSNYIMYEDTVGQCTTKFNVASGYFNSMSTSQRATFMTSDDYVISTARERFEAWARSLGKTISYTNGDYVIQNARPMQIIGNATDNSTLLIVVVSVIMGGIAIGGYFFIRKKKYQ